MPMTIMNIGIRMERLKVTWWIHLLPLALMKREYLLSSTTIQISYPLLTDRGRILPPLFFTLSPFGAACRANQLIAQGNTLGCLRRVGYALTGQQHYYSNTLSFPRKRGKDIHQILSNSSNFIILICFNLIQFEKYLGVADSFFSISNAFAPAGRSFVSSLFPGRCPGLLACCPDGAFLFSRSDYGLSPYLHPLRRFAPLIAPSSRFAPCPSSHEEGTTSMRCFTV